MKIVLLGTRGIPARYGGFETFAEELSTRLVERGNSVTVYGRRLFFAPNPGEATFNGVELRYAPTIMHKYLETIVSSFTSFFDILWHRPDIVLLCNAANAPFAWMARIAGIPVAINVDGIERKRAKWNFFGRLWYRLGEICSVFFASRIVSDAKVIADYYLETYKANSTVIAYGAKAVNRSAGETIKKFGLTPGQYILYVARLEPENNALGVVQAFVQSKIDLPLVVVGDAPYAKEYIESLKRAANNSVIFTGFQFGEAYQELQSNCLLYIQATEVGGTHPALIESMAYGNCIIANGTPENHEVLGDAGEFYPKNDFQVLSEILSKLVKDEEKRKRYKELAKNRAQALYQWDKITTQYEALFKELLN